MPAERRLWDSNVIIDYPGGNQDVAAVCGYIIEAAERGEVDIAVSVLATVEVAYLEGMDDDAADARIRELFDRDYIVPIQIDPRVASIARDLIRKYRTRGLTPPDALHVATAIRWRFRCLRRGTRSSGGLMAWKGTRKSRFGRHNSKDPAGCLG